MQQSGQTPCWAGLTPIDPALLSAPIDYLHAVHLRKREVCALLDRIAHLGGASGAEIEDLICFLSDELPAHLADEETDLFPLLRRRCTEDDDIDRLIDRLQTDHRHADFDTPRVTAILKSAPAGIEPDACSELRRYAEHARRHLNLENAVLLPFARLRLTREDLAKLRAAMARRRGLAEAEPRAHPHDRQSARGTHFDEG